MTDSSAQFNARHPKRRSVRLILYPVSEARCRTNNAIPDKTVEQNRLRKAELLQWLWPQRLDINWDKDLGLASNAAPTTCAWLLSSYEYPLWRNGGESCVAWLHGIQGSGKTTLAAYPINHLRRLGEKPGLLLLSRDNEFANNPPERSCHINLCKTPRTIWSSSSCLRTVLRLQDSPSTTLLQPQMTCVTCS